MGGGAVVDLRSGFEQQQNSPYAWEPDLVVDLGNFWLKCGFSCGFRVDFVETFGKKVLIFRARALRALAKYPQHHL